MKRQNRTSRTPLYDKGFCKRLVTLLCGVSFVLGFASLLSAPAGAQVRIGLPIHRFAPKKHPDFDGDGYADLAIGAPFEPLGSVRDAGAVHVLYGSPNGMAWPRNQVLQRSPMRPDQAAYKDGFGEVIVWGDFNGDGYDDLAVGIPNAVDNEGHVNVYYGGPGGLNAAMPQIWTRTALLGPDRSEAESQFGINLAVGDFNGDGYADLVVLGEQERYVRDQYAGIAHIVYGSATGLQSGGNQIISTGQIVTSLQAGDFNRDGCAELAMGFSGESVRNSSGQFITTGAVHIYAGSRGGLIVSRISQIFTEASIGLQNGSGMRGGFGGVMTTGDFNGDGYPDLAIGSGNYAPLPTEHVHVLNGGAGGLSTFGNQLVEGLESVSALASGDFDGDGFSDLVVGLASASVHRREGFGMVRVFGGTRFGVRPQLFRQEWDRFSPGILGGVSTPMSFGASLLAADFTHSGYDALAIGAPFDHAETGSVNVLFGSSAGLSVNGNQIIMVGQQGVLGTVANNFEFGNLRGGTWLWPMSY